MAGEKAQAGGAFPEDLSLFPTHVSGESLGCGGMLVIPALGR